MAIKTYLLVCGGTGCVAGGGANLYEALKRELGEQGVSEEAQVVRTGCFGFCEKGPIVKCLPDETFYVQVKPEDAKEIVAEHVVKGRPVARLLLDPQQAGARGRLEDVAFYQKQVRVVLRNCGVIDPESIDEYIARDGYAALAKALSSMEPEQIIEEVRKSGLRGRGGGGFHTARKWTYCRKAEGPPKFVICNGDEGDPGAFMDRSLMEGNPHSVIEGMIIGAYAIGASRGYIYVRNEYPLAVEHLTLAISQARAAGLLGESILGSGFSFDIRINRGGGAFVCGESTALIASLEGRSGEPRAKYVHTVEHGLNDLPTNLNNAETWANIPAIVRGGGDWFASVGTEGSKGTKVFSLVGKVVNTGLVEVPMGMTLRQIVEEIGGGVRDGKTLKAVQTGGPSGGCIPAQHRDAKVDFDELTKLGSMMGSGGMIVMDEDTCMVNVAKYFLNFLKEESCGKCTPCREGIPQMLHILERISTGEGQEGDLGRLEDLAVLLEDAALCALGSTAANPVLSTVRYFRDEYEAHIHDKRCPAKVCRGLFLYEIDPEACRGCGICAKNCPVDAISGERKQPHVIDQQTCTKCGTCLEKCPFGAVLKV